MEGQLDISACGTNVSLRYAFRVPVYGGRKGDKLAGFKLVRVVMGNLISKEDLWGWLGGDLNKLCQLFMEDARNRVAKVAGLKDAYLAVYQGIDVCEHRPMTKPADDDPRWV